MKIVIGDLHYQTYTNLDIYNNKVIDSAIDKKIKDFCTIKDDNKDTVDIIFNGDIYNILFGKTVEKEKEKMIAVLEKIYNLMLPYIEDRDIKRIIYIPGNHEFYINRRNLLKDTNMKGNYFLDTEMKLKESSIIGDKIVEEAFKEVFFGEGIEFIKLNNNYFINENNKWNKEIYMGSLLYSPILSKTTLLEENFLKPNKKTQKALKEYTTKINDSMFYNRIIKRLKRKFLKNKNLFDWLNENKDIKKMVKQYKQIINIIYNDNKQANELDANKEQYVTVLIFLYHYLMICKNLKEIINNNSDNKIKTLNLFTHFSFDVSHQSLENYFEENEYNLEISNWSRKFDSQSNIYKWYRVDLDYLMSLLSYINKIKWLKEINIYNSHTHDNFKFKTIIQNKKLNITNVSLWYAQQLTEKQYFAKKVL